MNYLRSFVSIDERTAAVWTAAAVSEPGTAGGSSSVWRTSWSLQLANDQRGDRHLNTWQDASWTLHRRSTARRRRPQRRRLTTDTRNTSQLVPSATRPVVLPSFGILVPTVWVHFVLNRFWASTRWRLVRRRCQIRVDWKLHPVAPSVVVARASAGPISRRAGGQNLCLFLFVWTAMVYQLRAAAAVAAAKRR